MKKTLCATLAVLILILSIAPACAISFKNVKAGQTLYVSTRGGTLSMRNADVAEAAVIYRLANGSPVTATRKYSGGYLYVTYSVGSVREEGWVDIKYLSATRPTSNSANQSKSDKSAKETVASMNFRSFKLIPADTTYIVASKPSRTGGYVNLRWVPSMDSAIIERMRLGEEMTVIAEGNKWLQVRCADGWVGYIVKSYTSVVYHGKTADYEALQAE